MSEEVLDPKDEKYRGGVILEHPQFEVITANRFVGFDPKAGVGDNDNPHALIRLTMPLVWRDHKRLVRVKLGFVCDGASVPPKIWGIIDATWLDLLIAALLHDKLYRIGAQILDLGTNSMRVFDREEADKVLSKAAQMAGCDWDDAKKVYWGVRMGGGSSWQQKSEFWTPELAS